VYETERSGPMYVWHTLPQHTPPPLSCRSGYILAHLTPAYPTPLSCRSGYKEQDDLVVFDGADQSQYGHCHEQRATYPNTHQDWDIGKVGQCSRRYYQTNQKYTNHLCTCVCVCGEGGGDTSIFDCHLHSFLYCPHDSRLCVPTLHNH